MTTQRYKFHSEDTGFCRVYYTCYGRLYCIQNDGSFGRDNYVFYECTSDGEPSYPVSVGIPPADLFEGDIKFPDSNIRETK